MPRRKPTGVNASKRPPSLKSHNPVATQVKKAFTFEKIEESNDCIKASPIRLQELPTVPLAESNENYLHKKFKKMAGIKTDRVANGGDGDSPPAAPPPPEPQLVRGHDSRSSSPSPRRDDVPLSANPGRYVCPYCQLACAKPSVLQKHIRAHTNERPYPCSPCGFAFKTKSNLYKHCRSQAHRVKAGENATFERGDSGEELSDDSSSNPSELPNSSPGKSEPDRSGPPQRGSDTDTSESANKIYKPKFHKATLYQDDREVSNSDIKQKIQEGIYEKKKKMEIEERKEKPQLKMPCGRDLRPGLPSPVLGKGLPPSPEFLHQHISKIISDNQAIVETMEPQWTKKFLQRQNSREKESSSPLAVYPEARRPAKEDAKSKLALALLKADKSEPHRFSPSYPNSIQVNLDNQTYQPLNLTKRDEEKARVQTTGGSMIKEILIKSREAKARLGQYSPQTMAEILSSLNTPPPGPPGPPGPREEVYQCAKCNITYNSLENMNIHQLYYCNDRASPAADASPARVEPPYLSPGPLLGTTPLLDVKADSGPPPKKRRIQSTTIPPDTSLLYTSRRLSTSSLPAVRPNGLAKSPSRPSSSPSTTLKSLEELSKYPMKQTSLNMFGGEVKILDCGETKTMRIDSNPNPSSPMESPSEDSSKFFVTIAKTGLHSGGGTLVHVPTPPVTTSSSSFQMASILSYPDTTKLLMPLVPNIATPNLTVPGVPTPQSFPDLPSFGHNGILTIVHGGKHIPYVPGIPGPQSVTATDSVKKEEPKRPPKESPPAAPTKTVSSLISVRKLSSSNTQKNVPNEIPKIEISCAKTEPEDSKAEESSTKFLRPTSLPLKPGSFTPKRLHQGQGCTPTVLSLVSPETPRPKKSYGQLFLNGHAYTYLGLKCSTRSYYCTISRPQPMYVAQSPQHAKLSMYSNWKVYSDSDPSLLGLTPAKAMANYDSRHRSPSYTIAGRTKTAVGIVTHSSSWLKASCRVAGKEDASENGSCSGESAPKRVKIFAGGFESNEDYTYVRGRGRGRYVCEECGIRCKKPSMLKKHIRTHTDVRPYTCKHCTFSFKTKGNLTKHMKSKAHYKKCLDLNLAVIPTTVEAENVDEELVARQAAEGECEEEGEDGEGEDEDDEDDEEEEGHSEDTTTEDPESLEREAACSLLSLSETTPRSAQLKTLFAGAGLLPKSRPSTYPYPTSKPAATDDAPMDLSQSRADKALGFLSKDSEFLSKPKTEEPRPANPVPAYLLASIANSGQQQEALHADLPGSHMLQAYLTAKALHDVKMKQQQSKPKEETHRKFDNVSQLHHNFSRVYEVSRMEEEGAERRPGERGERSDPEVSSVTVETSSGKKILVSFPAESERPGSPPPAALHPRPADGKHLKAEFFPPSSGPSPSYVSVTEDGRSICVICNKIFTKPSQLRLHVNIHYFERPFRCEACAVSFRTKGHLQKHERSVLHHNKVSMNTTFGTATTSNPRPFKCDDCKIAFRIHGHLAKHLRSKMHIMKLECIGKLPFGTYAEMERSGINLNEIDTTDCDNSLESLQLLAQKLYEKDPSKLGQLPQQPHSTSKPNHSTNHLEEDGGGGAKDGDDADEESSSDGYQSEGGEACNGRPAPHKCGLCDELCDGAGALQVHLFAEHNKVVVEDSHVCRLKPTEIEKSVKSTEDSLTVTEKSK